MQPTWYRNAVIYQIDVAHFRTDLRGTADRLEYVRGLGADCVWLLPFFETPYRDGGYDVTNHLSVDPRFGDVADFAYLMDRADALGVRVVIDLVAQHTSIDHPWFQEARRDRSSPYRAYYVWADEPVDTGVEQNFPTVEDGVWTWDEEAGQYYRHTFYSHEPDLDLGHPRVIAELERVMSFWLRLGVSGFRVDALPSMVERARAADPRQDGLWLVEHMHDYLAVRRADAILLGEVDVRPKQYADYLRGGRGMTMLLDFWTNNHLFLALARSEAEPVVRALAERPPAPGRGQYATYLRNHDELDLERLTENERDEVVRIFAPDQSMRAYGRGIRRRLAPMLDGDERRIAMAHALLLSVPGAPVLLYGDEIGMSDDLSREERRAVRTPMQWEEVHRQTTSTTSLLAQVGNLVRTRLGRREIGSGRCEPLDVGDPAVLCVRHELDEVQLFCLVNLSDREVTVEVPDTDTAALVDILANDDLTSPGDAGGRVELSAYGYRWLQRPQDLFG
ncbi:alpha-amylase family glycosyl hydrolase [Pimelobacter simplex]|uniref:alpha-amylase family glycosyl hydrolase n=1 Tax=Nocardioides simplex TaxID=2045 RepID=UPI0019342692|nr:alpha-glucosidase C-terminal domain-containing protein [Pimelobacter simplex]